MLDLLWVIGGGIVTLVIVAAVACWIAREHAKPPPRGFPLAEPDAGFDPVDSRAEETHDRQGDV